MVIKKIFFTCILAGLVFFSAPTLVSAAPDIGFGDCGLVCKIAGSSGYDVSGQSDTTLAVTIGGFIRIILSFLGVIFLVLTIYAGVLWMTAAGNDDNISKAKDILQSATIGLIIILASYGITALVMYLVMNANAPSTDAGRGDKDATMGCCVYSNDKKCKQTNSKSSCMSNDSKAKYYPNESCTPHIAQNVGCSIEVDF